VGRRGDRVGLAAPHRLLIDAANILRRAALAGDLSSDAASPVTI
jgi:hypothetical protein